MTATINRMAFIWLLRWLSDKESACQCRRHKSGGLNPGSGRSPRGGNGNPLQYSCQDNAMDRGAWWITVHGIAKSRTQLSTTMLWYEGDNVPGTLQMETTSSTATPLQALHSGLFWGNWEGIWHSFILPIFEFLPVNVWLRYILWWRRVPGHSTENHDPRTTERSLQSW